MELTFSSAIKCTCRTIVGQPIWRSFISPSYILHTFETKLFFIEVIGEISEPSLGVEQKTLYCHHAHILMFVGWYIRECIIM